MAASMLRLRAAAAAGGYRQLSSSAACLMLPPNKMYSLGEKKVVNIESPSNIEKEFESGYAIGSSHGWVGMMKEGSDRRSSGSVSLWNPMSGSRAKLPTLDTIYHCPSYRLVVEKLVVDDAECSRAIIAGNLGLLAVCCPGRCSEWNMFGPSDEYLDLVAWQSRVYTFSIYDELVRWDVSDPRKPRKEWEKCMYELGYDTGDDDKKNFPRKPDHLLCYTYLHLVYAEHSGEVFLVFRHVVAAPMNPRGADDEDRWNSSVYPGKTVAFDVRLLVENEGGKGLAYMEHSLDGLVMFVGISNSFAVAAADFPHLNPDSIYFTDSSRISPDEIHGGHDIGIYDYKNRSISSCYYPSHHHSFKKIDPNPFWLTPTSKTLKGFE